MSDNKRPLYLLIITGYRHDSVRLLNVLSECEFSQDVARDIKYLKTKPDFWAVGLTTKCGVGDRHILQNLEVMRGPGTVFGRFYVQPGQFLYAPTLAEPNLKQHIMAWLEEFNAAQKSLCLSVDVVDSPESEGCVFTNLNGRRYLKLGDTFHVVKGDGLFDLKTPPVRKYYTGIVSVVTDAWDELAKTMLSRSVPAHLITR